MVNSDILPAGTYAIRPKDAPQDIYLTIGPHISTEPPPDALVEKGRRFPWVLKDTDTDTSTVHAKVNGYKWVIKDRVLFVSAVKEAVELNLRSDNGFVFIDIPGIISSRLTYHKDASPSQPIFTFQEADNSSAQLFQVERDY